LKEHLHTVDVAVVGAGLAGLATALALLEKQPRLRIAVLSPSEDEVSTKHGFGSNQPAIASHPHFSKDHNLLSQWTSYCLPENDRVLNAAVEVNPSIVIARGRWQLAKTPADAVDIRERIVVFNDNVAQKLHAYWHSDVGEFGALSLPSAWAISPLLLRTVWLEQLTKLGCEFIDGYAQKLAVDQQTSLQYKVGDVTKRIDAKNIVLCSPACLQNVLVNAFEGLNIQDCLPLVQWPGQSKIEVSVERSAMFGISTVQDESYAIALGDNEWLVRDEAQTAAIPFRGDRWHTPDRLPFLGPMFDTSFISANAKQFWKNDLLVLPSEKNVFINTAHGTRGLLSGIGGAAVVANMLLGLNTSLTQSLASAVNPDRYIRRALRQHFNNLQSSNKT
jgi:glycine/D-amino acid oxidase-like deaminating enzyme